jgi:hypothetical protein
MLPQVTAGLAKGINSFSLFQGNNGVIIPDDIVQ